MADDEGYDLPLVQGETKTLVFDATVDGTPVDFSDYDAVAHVRDDESTRGRLLLNLTPYLAVTDDGLKLTLRIPGPVLAVLDADRFGAGAYWDLFLISKADPNVTERFLQGHVTLDPATTQTVEVLA